MIIVQQGLRQTGGSGEVASGGAVLDADRRSLWLRHFFVSKSDSADGGILTAVRIPERRGSVARNGLHADVPRHRGGRLTRCKTRVDSMCETFRNDYRRHVIVASPLSSHGRSTQDTTPAAADAAAGDDWRGWRWADRHVALAMAEGARLAG